MSTANTGDTEGATPANFKSGDRVWWTDPDDGSDPHGGSSSGMGTVVDAVQPQGPDTVIAVEKDDGGEVEAYPHELTKIVGMTFSDWRKVLHTTVHAEVEGQALFEAAIRKLVAHSVWFAVTPLPDDVWRVSLKVGDGHILYAIDEFGLTKPGAAKVMGDPVRVSLFWEDPEDGSRTFVASALCRQSAVSQTEGELMDAHWDSQMDKSSVLPVFTHEVVDEDEFEEATS